MSSTEIAGANVDAPVRSEPIGRSARRVPVDRTEPITDRTVRKFGGVALIGFALLGALLNWRGHTTAAEALLIFGAAVGIFALVLPGPARPLYRGWMRAAHVLGRINTTVLLSLFYGIMICGLGLIFRLIRRDALRFRFDLAAKTYWEPKKMPSDPRRYFDQF